jgi:hypothetical protein
VTGSFWNGVVGFFDKLWVYDLGGGGHGPAQWSQFGGNSRHSGFFPTRIELRLDDDVLLWQPVAAASGYDVVRGDLDTLRATGGDFSAATEDCIANDVTDLQVVEPAHPLPGQAHWFLVRATTGMGHGSYDGAVSQAGPRDPGINASPFGCP